MLHNAVVLAGDGVNPRENQPYNADAGDSLRQIGTLLQQFAANCSKVLQNADGEELPNEIVIFLQHYVA